MPSKGAGREGGDKARREEILEDLVGHCKDLASSLKEMAGFNN